jgi:hypothetical protein
MKKQETFYSRAIGTYSNKGMMKSARLDADVKTAQVRAFENGGAQKVETASSLKVVRYEVIGGKKFKVIR